MFGCIAFEANFIYDAITSTTAPAPQSAASPAGERRRKAVAYRSQDVRVSYRAAVSDCHRLRLILARGQLRPPLHPPDQGVPPLDPTRRASPSGLPTGRCFTLRPPDRCFDSGFDQESLRALHGPPDRGRLRSPPGPLSTRRVPPWTCTRAVRPSTAAGLSRPCPARRAAPVP